MLNELLLNGNYEIFIVSNDACVPELQFLRPFFPTNTSFSCLLVTSS